MIKCSQYFIGQPTIKATEKSFHNCEVKIGFPGKIERAKMRAGNLIHKCAAQCHASIVVAAPCFFRA